MRATQAVRLQFCLELPASNVSNILQKQPQRLDRQAQNHQLWQRPIVSLDHVEDTLAEFWPGFLLALEEITNGNWGILEVHALLTSHENTTLVPLRWHCGVMRGVAIPNIVWSFQGPGNGTASTAATG